ncbi:unnamed protein product [Tilletia controversa]|nr:unnamed protein product [Tilletia controversa]
MGQLGQLDILGIDSSFSSAAPVLALASLASGPELQRPQLASATAVRSIDVTAMKKLSDVANVAPVIPKSDPLTMDERTGFKQPLVRSRSPPLRSMPHHNAPCRVERAENCKDV